MNVEAQQRVDEYIYRLRDLYVSVKTWLAHHPIRVSDKDTSVVEMMSGEYQAPALEFYSATGGKLAELEPIGTWIISALGRVDLKGANDVVNFLYFAEGGPSVTATFDDEEKQPAPVFRGIEHAGWYWIENVRLRRVRILDAELFLDLFSEVSDYGRQFVAR